MDSQQIAVALQEIAGVSKKTAKRQLLARYGADADFMRVLRAALGGSVTYGISKIPPVPRGPSSFDFDDDTWSLLDRLAKRQLTGGAARTALADELSMLNDPSADLLVKIIKKDLRAGFSVGTVNTLFPGAIPNFECMLAHPFEAKRVTDWPVFIEPKIDGWRALAFLDFTAPTPTAKFFKRSGKEIGIVEHLKPLLLERLAGIGGRLVVDGEIISGSFNETASSLQTTTEQATDAVYVAFDLLTQEEWDSPDEDGFLPAPPYEERCLRLDALWTALPRQIMHMSRLSARRVLAMPRQLVECMEDIHQYYEEYRELGLEGAIVKPAAGRYRLARDYAWMKLKGEESVDVPVTGALPGEEGKQFANTLGKLVVDFNGVEVHVGGGLSVAQRDEFWQAWLRDRARIAQNSALPLEIVGQIAEIEYHEVTPDGSLRSPRFKRFRQDKQVGGR